MKINLNQPNGLTSMYAPDSHKYLDVENPISIIIVNFSQIKEGWKI